MARLERASVNNTETIDWMASTLGTMKAGQEMHTRRLDGIDAKLDDHTKRFDDHAQRLGRIEADVKEDKVDVRGMRADIRGLVEALPNIIAQALREVLAKK